MQKTLGGAFLVVGTTIGAGMLSLPLITAACGLWLSIILIILSWSVMYFTSLKLIRLCENQSLGVNYTSLIKSSMPIPLQVIFTIVYLLLLYALMSAYTTQGASLVAVVSATKKIPVAIDVIIFVLIFGMIILNTKLSDYINRSFVSIKIIFYTLCILSMLFYLKINNMISGPISLYAIIFAWPTLLPSFGFQNIIPVLYEYQKGDTLAIKRSVLIGSLIVLIIYIMWLFVCLSILPQHGLNGYGDIFAQGNTLESFIATISNSIHNSFINTFLAIFINISVITSFICAGLSLYHYIKDTFKRCGYELNKTFGFVLTFTPPFCFTTFYPKGFILALQYAAIFAVIIFVFTPIYLDIKNRYKVTNIYPLTLGSLVIIAQIINLTYSFSPF